MKKNIFIVIFIVCSIKVFSQNDSTHTALINLKAGAGNVGFAFITDLNLSKKISVQAGLMSLLFINRASLGLKYSVFRKNIQIKTGAEYSIASVAFLENKTTWVLIGIPVEFIYKRLSVETQPALLFERKKYEEFANVFVISYIFHL